MNPFGPILRFELVRVARRQRLILSRCLYAVLLALIAAATYLAGTEFGAKRALPRDLAVITEGLFYTLFTIQFFLAAGAAVNWTADVFTTEKERRTLPFLLATPLSDHEIVLGKFAARLAQIGVFVLAGLPVLCALQFYGGVEPMAVLVGYSALAVTVLSLGSLSLLCSIYTKTARAAGQRAARVVGMYVVALMIIGRILGRFPRIAAWPGTAMGIGDLVDLLDAGNPLAIGNRLVGAIQSRTFDAALGPAVLNYIVFHLLAAIVFLGWAILRLRPVAAVQAEGAPPPPQTGLRRSPPRPPVGEQPVLWKALHFDFRQYRTAGGRAFAQVMFVLSYVPVVLVLAIMAYFGEWRQLPDVINVGFIRILGSLVLCGVLVMIAAQAAGCIARERRKQTLDELLLTDLTTDEILAQKWWASIVVVRPALVWVGVHWLIAVVAGALHPLAIPLLAVEWLAYAAFAASLGIYWAARMPTARATQVAVGLLGFGSVSVPIAVGGLVFVAIEGRGGWFALPMSMSPLFALPLSAFTAGNLAHVRDGTYAIGPGVVGGIIGVVAAGVLARMLWREACLRFPRR